MTWIIPTVPLPKGIVRSVIQECGDFDRRAYARAYYHAVRKHKLVRKPLTAEQKARRTAKAKERYESNPQHFRALARANYWRHRDEYAAKSKARKSK